MEIVVTLGYFTKIKTRWYKERKTITLYKERKTTICIQRTEKQSPICPGQGIPGHLISVVKFKGFYISKIGWL